jgi:hypothetical protein
MISLQKRFLFVHIPKTAGNSIQSVLRDYSEDQLVALRKEQDGIERFGLRNPKYKIKKHSTLSEYHDALGDEQFRICISSPVCGILGSNGVVLFHAHAKSRNLEPEKIPRDNFQSCVGGGLFATGQRRRGPVRQCRLHHAVRKSGRRLSCCVHGDWHFAINPAAIQPLNREHYSKYYDDELREFVRTRFAAEIERFDYTFEEQ